MKISVGDGFSLEGEKFQFHGAIYTPESVPNRAIVGVGSIEPTDFWIVLNGTRDTMEPAQRIRKSNLGTHAGIKILI